MQKARRHALPGAPTACRQTGSGSLSLPCSGFFSPFPHGTCPLSVSWEYLALRDGPRRFSQDFSCPAILRIHLNRTKLSCTGLSPSAAARPRAFHFARLNPYWWPYYPGLASTTPVWAIPRSLPFRDGRPSACRVAPFGHPGINGCLRLRPAFRSLPRPSSPPGAKASTVCPSLAS